MSHLQINLSPDLKKLRDEGFQIEVKEGYLLIHQVPYVNSEKKIVYGILVSKLDLAGDKTVQPSDHASYFIGELPCHKDGFVIRGIISSSGNQKLIDGLEINHTLSAKLRDGQYTDYYHKMRTYVNILLAEAQAIDPNVTANTFKVIESDDPESVFNYTDTNSSRAEIISISSKLKNLKVAIVGLGGTGSYVLDFVAKTPVKEIHLFDGDDFLQHNAFRSPGAPSKDELDKKYKKVVYLCDIYSRMRKNIFTHEFHIDNSSLDELSSMDFVFLCIDGGEKKKFIIDKLLGSNVRFIDTGIGVGLVNDKLRGSVRVTTSTPEKNDHLTKRISFSEEEVGDYSQNIQIAELNALNAVLAVIKWKKLFGYYHDFEKEHNSIYNIDVNQLTDEDLVS